MTQLFTTEAFQRGHRNWAERPTDEGFDTIEPVIEKLRARHGRSLEGSINLKNLAHDGDIVAHGEEIELIQPNGERYHLTPWGFRALCKRIGAHTEFLKKLPAENVAADLKVLLRDTNGLEDGPSNWDQDQQMLTLGTTEKGLRLIRHIASERYGRIWDLDVMLFVQRIMDEYGFTVPPTWDTRPRGLYVGDQDCFAFLQDESKVIELTRPDGTKEGLKRGLMIWNSEVGKRTFGLCSYLYQMICGNHIVWGAQNIQTLETRHVGDALVRATQELMPQANAYLNSSTETEMELLNRAMRVQVAPDGKEAIRVLRAKGGFTKTIAEDAMVLAKTHETNVGLDPLSYMAVVNGLTLIARDEANGDARNLLETRASAFLRMAA